MEKIKIEAQVRAGVGKGFARRTRMQGAVPGIVYGKDINLPVAIDVKDLKILNSVHFSRSVLIEMEIKKDNKKDKHAVLIKDLQYNPLTDGIIHIDFMKVSLEEKIRVNVPVYLIGDSIGVKEGGILEQILREVELEGLPLEIPEKLELDISTLNIGHSVHVSDLKIPAGLKVITHPEETIVTIVLHVEEEVAAPAQGGITPEPEVIKEKKEVPGEGEEAKKEEKPEKAADKEDKGKKEKK